MVNVALYGKALHPLILRAMDYLLAHGILCCPKPLTSFIIVTGTNTVGIFRRTAAKAKVEALKRTIENSSGLISPHYIVRYIILFQKL